jgi:chemotaxis protein MotB
MSGTATRGRRRRHTDGGHESEERWLLTYADMITLLLALFVVLFAISSVNTSKVKALQQSLRDAFSGKVMSGGEAIMETGNSVSVRTLQSQPRIIPNTPSLGQPPNSPAARESLAARREEDELQHLKRMLDAYAAEHGFKAQVETVVTQRGLVVRLLTDNVLFDSGLAEVKAQGVPLLAEVGTLLGVDKVHPIVVEGHTDDVPIATSKFESNWELSTARASAVVRWLIGRSVPARRFSAAGYADLHPLGSNGSAAGRARNRRVEIVLQRIHNLPEGNTP